MNAAKQLHNSGAMDIDEAAEYVARKVRRPFTAKTLRNRMANGTGPRRIKRLGRLEFLESDLDAWIKSNTTVMR